ncbi:MAG: hypothetical protein NXI10_08895 [bacterium]|nr:hypothetical protein [bacterium]
MLDALDKYKFGLLAAVMTYMIIFMYSNAVTFDYIIERDPILAETTIEDKDEALEITPDEIDVPEDFDYNAEVKNLAQSKNDDREASYDDYGPPKSSNQIAQDIKALEAQMQQEAGGSAERAKLQRLIDQRKEEQKQAKESENNTTPSTSGSDKKYAGYTMVEWDLDDRKAHNNNREAIRNPGYTCGDRANGVVVVDVKTNYNGNVISAKYNAARSTGATSCMIERAIQYAKMSRFEYSNKANEQTGYIKYTFVYK